MEFMKRHIHEKNIFSFLAYEALLVSYIGLFLTENI